MPAWQTVQMLGALGALSYVAARVARASGVAALHRYVVVAQPRDRLPAMPAGYRVETMTPAALAGHTVDASPQVQAARFAGGLTCLAAFNRKGVLTGVVWLCGHRYDEDEVQVRFLLPDGCCWDTGLWIAPQYRLTRAYAALWAGAAEWMERNGYGHSLSRISDYNLAALHPHRRMGARVLSRHTFVRLGRWQWSFGTRPRLVRIAGGVPDLDLRKAALG